MEDLKPARVTYKTILSIISWLKTANQNHILTQMQYGANVKSYNNFGNHIAVLQISQ